MTSRLHVPQLAVAYWCSGRLWCYIPIMYTYVRICSISYRHPAICHCLVGWSVVVVGRSFWRFHFLCPCVPCPHWMNNAFSYFFLLRIILLLLCCCTSYATRSVVVSSWHLDLPFAPTCACLAACCGRADDARVSRGVVDASFLVRQLLTVISYQLKVATTAEGSQKDVQEFDFAASSRLEGQTKRA